MKYSKAPLLLAAFVVLLLASTALARPPHRGGEPAPGRFLERNAAQLGIDAGTKQQIAEITEASREANGRIREQLRQAHDGLRALLAADPVDEAAVIDQAKRIGELESEKRISRLRAVIQIQGMLTPEQRAQLAELQKSRPRRHGEQGRRLHEAARSACRDDRQKLCADARRGPASHHCLMDQREALSVTCRDALEAMPPPPAGGPDAQRGPGNTGRPPGPPASEPF